MALITRIATSFGVWPAPPKMLPEQSVKLAFLDMQARWQSGHADDCNSSYAGSIPTRASISKKVRHGHRNIKGTPQGPPAESAQVRASRTGLGGEIGRRKGLKIPRPNGRAGSIPARGTIFQPALKPHILLSDLYGD